MGLSCRDRCARGDRSRPRDRRAQIAEIAGTTGYTLNLDTLAAAYLAAAALSLLFLRDHRPAGDLLHGPDETVLRAI